jgi:hypothetical protein
VAGRTWHAGCLQAARPGQEAGAQIVTGGRALEPGGSTRPTTTWPWAVQPSAVSSRPRCRPCARAS